MKKTLLTSAVLFALGASSAAFAGSDNLDLYMDATGAAVSAGA